jgi:hypothetical protein
MEALLQETHINYKEHIITPITPYLLCQHYFSTEIYPNNIKYIGMDIHSLISTANDLYTNKNINAIKEGDIIQVQVDLFEHFIHDILPQITKNVIIITSQYHLPQLFRNETTDLCLQKDNIILWISQNPIYENHPKYMAFPYGVCHSHVDAYMNYLKQKDIRKTVSVYTSNMNIRQNLPPTHIRRHPIFASSSVPIRYTQYLDKIAESKFVISLSGDRDDCYRHYECIGLQSIPISDVHYNEIFEKNMITFDLDHIIKTINGEIEIDYYEVDRDILTITYWKNKINKNKGLL